MKPAISHPSVAEAARNPIRRRLVLRAHLFEDTLVKGRWKNHSELWRAIVPCKRQIVGR